MLVDDANKVMVCLHAKVGCTTWKTILANNTGDVHMNIELNIHPLLSKYSLYRLNDERYSDDDINYRLANYYKFMVVRHPYDR